MAAFPSKLEKFGYPSNRQLSVLDFPSSSQVEENDVYKTEFPVMIFPLGVIRLIIRKKSAL